MTLKHYFNISKNRFYGNGTDRYFLYIIYNPLSKLIKIGVTDSIQSRHRNLELSGGCKLHILLLAEFYPPRKGISANIVERILLEYFVDKKEIGEWCKLSPRDLVEVRNLLLSIKFADVKYHPFKYSDSRTIKKIHNFDDDLYFNGRNKKISDNHYLKLIT